MMQDVLWWARDSVEVARLGRVSLGSQWLETLGHLTLGFSEIARCLEALPATLQELVTQEGRALAQGVADHVLTCYRSRDPAFPLEPARQGVVETEEVAAWAAVREVATEVAEFFVRELGPGSDSSDDVGPTP